MRPTQTEAPARIRARATDRLRELALSEVAFGSIDLDSAGLDLGNGVTWDVHLAAEEA